MKNALICNVIIVMGCWLSSLSYAGENPILTFSPLTATRISIPSNGTTTVKYRVTNQSKKSHELVMTPGQGLTQITTAGNCPNPFTLNHAQSCTLNLTISGLQQSINQGPIVCDHGDPLLCYQPTEANSLNVLVNAFTVGGQVFGLSGTVVLDNNGGDALTITNSGPFTFATAIPPGSPYSVTIQTPPQFQNCTVVHGNGVMRTANVTSVEVYCSTRTHTVGGSVSSGLTGTVVLLNNGGDPLSISSNGPFTFPTPVAEGSPYAVTVGTQPANQTCTVSNGTGTMGGSNVTTVGVSCITNTTTITTSLSDLALSVTGLTNGPGGSPVPSGKTRTLTISNPGSSAAALNLNISYPAWPSGTSASSNCGSTLPIGSSCTISITPGLTATSDGSNPCSTAPGSMPTPGDITVSSSNANSVTTHVVVLSYGCIHQGGYLFDVDDTPIASFSINGKVADSTNGGDQPYQNAGFTCAATSFTDGKGNTDTLHNCSAASPAADECFNKSPANTWYLPALCQIGYDDVANCGGVSTARQNMESTLKDNGYANLSDVYWSSTEFSFGSAWIQNFTIPLQSTDVKPTYHHIRCVRDF